jgi:TM2 domain-containing membrane protein YozV
MCGVLAIVLGSLGVHKFILGMTTPGIIMLVVTLAGVTLGSCLVFPALASFAMGVIGLIEGIIYLTKTDEEFHQIYEVGKKGWF